MSNTLNATFPSAMRDQLRAVRTRRVAFASVRAVALALTVCITLMLAAMLLDWAVTLFDTRVRVLLTVTTLFAAAVTLVLTAWSPIRRALGWTTAAEQVDKRVPQLEERWLTVASLAATGREMKDSASQAMLDRVTQEAVAMSRLVQPQRVVSGRVLRRPLLGMGAALVALGIFFASHWGQTSILWQRFWSPTANISATQLKALTGDAIVPRGEALEITAEMTGLQRESVDLVLRRESTPREEELLTVNRTEGPLRFSVDVDETLTYRVQAGDGRTEWHTLTAIDYPELKEVQLTVTPPKYVDEPPAEKTLIPSRLRAVQGSHMELAIKPQIDLKSLTLKVAVPVPNTAPETAKEDEETATERVELLTLTRGDDGWYRFETSLVESFSFTPLLTSPHNLANKSPRVCRVEVIEDHAPVARIVGGGEGAARMDEKLDIRFEAHDDHGVATAELVIYEEKPDSGEPPKVLAVRQIPLGDQAMQKHVMGKMELDLKELGLKDGTNISYSVRVTDNRDLEIDPRSQMDQMLAAADPKSSMTDPLDKGSSDKGQGASDKSDGESSSDPSPSDPSQPGEQGEEEAVDPDAMLAMADPEKTGQPRADSEKGASSEHKAEGDSSKSETKTDLLDEKDATPGDETPGAKGADSNNSDKDKHPAEALMASTDPSQRKPGPPQDGAPQPGEKGEPAEPGDNTGDPSKTTPEKTDPSAALQGKRDPSKMKSGEKPSQGAPNGEAPMPSSDGQPMPAGETPPADGTQTGEPQASEAQPGSTSPNKSQPGEPRPSNSNSTEPMPSDPRPDGQITLAGEPDPSKPMADEDPMAPQPAGEPSNSSSKSPQLAMANSPSGGNTPPPKVNVRINPQQTESGQQQETDRRKLRITATLEAVAASDDPRRDTTKPIRDKVVLIDQMLEVIEGKLNALYQHEVDQTLRREKFQELEAKLKGVEEYVVALDESTRETSFEFVGLQMIDISSSHIVPAHDAVFLAVRTPDSGADLPTEEALHHVVSARELLQALLKRYDRVAQDQELAEKLDETVKMYNVYVERSQRLMREAQQNLDPLQMQRAMEVFEVDQAYLDRLAEVTRMRRDMMTALAGILADDPRLRSRYLDLIKRRRSSLGNQLAELAARQDQAAQEVLGWLSVDENQRSNYWQQVSDLRLDLPNTLAKEAQQLSDRIEKQLPLALDPDVGASAGAIKTAKQLALDARRCDLAVRELRKSGDATTVAAELLASAESLAYQVGEMAAVLDRIGFESESQDGVADYIQRRQIEVRAFADQADIWAVTARAVAQQSFPELAGLDQHQIAIATELLRTEMLNIETDLEGQFNDEVTMPQDVSNLTQDLQRVMEAITHNQSSATFALSEKRLEGAAAQQELALKGLEEAQKLLSLLRRKTAEALDQIKPPDPNIADLLDPTLDQFLTELEREPNIEAQLGIPDRPRNIRVLQDAMNWEKRGGAMLGASSQGAMARAQEMKSQKDMPNDSEKPDPQSAAKNKENQTDPSQMTEEEKQQLADSQEMQQMLKERMEKARGELEKQAQDPSKSEEQRRQLAEMAKQMGQSLKQMEQGQTPEQLWRQMVAADQANAALEALAKGEAIPDEQWNKLMSTLGDGQGQVSGRVPSEDYRKSIEQYQERIRKLTGKR